MRVLCKSGIKRKWRERSQSNQAGMPHILITLFVLFARVECGKILVFNPLMGLSHASFVNKIAEALVTEGHDVTVLMPIYDTELVSKVKQSSAKLITVSVDPRTDALYRRERAPGGSMRSMWTVSDPTEMGNALAKVLTYQCEKVVNDEPLLKQLRAEQFELGITEYFDSCGFGIFHLINLTNHVTLNSGPLLDEVAKAIGVPAVPSYVPAIASSEGAEMSLIGRAKNTFFTYMGMFFLEKIEVLEEEIIRKHGEYRGTKDAIARSAFVMTNSNPYLDFPHPTIQKVVEIGGIAVPRNPKKLDATFDAALSKRKHTVFVSFGSVAKSAHMPEEYKNTLLSVFASLPDVYFIWKYEKPSEMEGRVGENVMLTEWAPQADMLADPRLSLFITHGGLGSVTETAFSGVRAIVIPLFGDQPRNARMFARHGGARVLQKEDLSDKATVKRAVEEMLVDAGALSNATRLALILRNAPLSGRELLAKHIDFTLKFGALPQLDPHGRHLSFVQHFLLDLAAIALLLTLVLLGIVLFAIRAAYRMCAPRKGADAYKKIN